MSATSGTPDSKPSIRQSSHYRALDRRRMIQNTRGRKGAALCVHEAITSPLTNTRRPHGHHRRMIWPSMSFFSALVLLLLAIILPSTHASPILDHSNIQELPAARDTQAASSNALADAVKYDASNSAQGRVLDGSLEIEALQLMERELAPRAALETDNSNTVQAQPQPFDSDLGNNFTSSSCPEFFNVMLTDPKFMACIPVSLLLQTSSAWFEELRQPNELHKTLNLACAVDQDKCSGIMSQYMTQLQEPSGCGADYKLSNPNVLMAYDGLSAYDAVYQATCLKRPGTKTYCFVAAATDEASPSDIDIYYLPLGMGMPSTAQPRCDTCVQQTLAGYAVAAANSSSLLNTDYDDAARQINEACGSAFVNVTVAQQTANSAYRSGSSTWLISFVSITILYHLL
ncbi:MAG: hypothetical protein M1828_006248 [Chrysothrix sp. TS-e1954]|nr:MAG: hypothetical protein M1828_006248 [Chrysothrix sp. TS-e1954]